ncbi:hypothetical protein [Nocardia salmonicida]|uniref:hypothetical protein n=1 Tax=Nocardia salmonicida TaxID=53431 RepID=UPI0033E0143C
MAYSIGIWRQPGSTAYRWESDFGTGSKEEGLVLVDAANKTVRPASPDGHPIGDLVLGADGEQTGNAGSVDPNRLWQIAVAILRKIGPSGELPETAHRHF